VTNYEELYWAERKISFERLQEAEALKKRVADLKNLIDTPHTTDFFEAVKLEAAHQRERWGTEHDAGKADQDWFWLLGYLAGKAIRPGEDDKKKHRIIATAAACLNWFRHVTGDSTDMRPGISPPEGS